MAGIWRKSVGSRTSTPPKTRSSYWHAPNNNTDEVALRLLHTKDSVIGLVSIPGMMTGAILGGASISQAVRYQQIIMFLISATTTLAVTLTCVICMILCLDGTHRLRPDRVSGQKPWMWRWRDNAAMAVWRGAKRAWKMVTCRAHVDSDDEGHPENGENHR